MCILFFVQLITPHLSEEMRRLQAAPMQVGRPKLQHCDAVDSIDEIESVANTYFHQMFCGQLTTEAMVQMLGRFKESSEKMWLSCWKCLN